MSANGRRDLIRRLKVKDAAVQHSVPVDDIKVHGGSEGRASLTITSKVHGVVYFTLRHFSPWFKKKSTH